MKPSVLFYFSFVLGLQVIYFDKFINNAEFLHFFVSDWMRKNQTKQVKTENGLFDGKPHLIKA